MKTIQKRVLALALVSMLTASIPASLSAEAFRWSWTIYSSDATQPHFSMLVSSKDGIEVNGTSYDVKKILLGGAVVAAAATYYKLKKPKKAE